MRVRYGMVGGGPGAFIGAVHRMAAALDGEIELVCGAFSSDAQRSAQSGAALHLPTDLKPAPYFPAQPTPQLEEQYKQAEQLGEHVVG